MISSQKITAIGLGALGLAVLAGSTGATAATLTVPTLVDHGTYTTDTSTNLDWLDLASTHGLSYNQVISNSGVNYIGQGWRYATVLELSTLFTDAGGSGHYPETTTSLTIASNPTIAAVTELSTLLGSGFDPVYTSYAGFLADQAPGGKQALAYISAYAYSPYFYGSLHVGDDSASPDQGFYYSSFLIRDSVATTPLPASLVMFVTALAALGYIAARQRRAGADQHG